MFHIFLHFLVPLVVALAFYRDRCQQAAILMLATMLVDIDHLLADPIYDPERCSIGFHPLHTTPAIAFYAGLAVLPLLTGRLSPTLRIAHLIGVGLLIHMALDGIDCLPQNP